MPCVFLLPFLQVMHHTTPCLDKRTKVNEKLLNEASLVIFFLYPKKNYFYYQAIKARDHSQKIFTASYLLFFWVDVINVQAKHLCFLSSKQLWKILFFPRVSLCCITLANIENYMTNGQMHLITKNLFQNNKTDYDLCIPIKGNNNTELV